MARNKKDVSVLGYEIPLRLDVSRVVCYLCLLAELKTMSMNNEGSLMDKDPVSLPSCLASYQVAAIPHSTSFSPRGNISSTSLSAA